MRRILTVACIACATITARAQVKIGGNPGTPVKSASLLELESSNRGVVFPRVSLTSINSPAPLSADLLAGTTVYNTNSGLPGGQGMYVWQGMAWSPLVTSQQRGGLQLQDSALNNPTVVGTYNTNGTGVGVAVSGDYAYVADGNAGLKIANISNPTAPALAGTVTTGGYAQNVVLSGNYAFVASGSAGLKVVNITTPTSPVVTATVSTTDDANHVFVFGNYAYIACNTAGVIILNINNPAAPVQVSSFNTGGVAHEVFVSGNYAYVASGLAGLKVVNINNPAVPALTGSFSTSNQLFNVIVRGQYAYLADGPDGLKVVNVGNPATPSLTSSLSIGDYAYHVALSGNYAYVSSGSAGIKNINISNPSNPQFAGGLSTSDARAVAINGNYAYIADGTGGLRVASLTAVVNTFSVTEATAQIGALRFPSGKGLVTSDESGVLKKVPVAGGLLVADAASNISTTTDYVSNNGTQTINGAKTFSVGVTAPSFSGNGATLSNVVNTTGTQTIGGAKTFSSPVSINGGGSDALTLLGGGDLRFVSGNGMTSASMSVQNGGVGADNATLSIRSGGKTFNFNGTAGTVSSDARLKQDIVPLRQSLKKIMQLNGYSYRFKTNAANPRKEFGVLAQEVIKVLPDAVFTDDRGMYSVSYDALVPVLINAVKEQQGQIDELKKTVAELKALVLQGAKR